MSPEQAGGRRLDFRSDQFSFGLVLYEMVTGKRAFQRSTAAETLVAILREQAEPIGAQNRDAPAPLCWAIERCLAKEPDKRYVSTRDLAHGNLRPYATASRRSQLSRSETRPDQSSCAADRVCGAREGSSSRQRTPAASGCAPGHGHGSGRNRQNASRGGGGEWPGRALSGWHSFCPALPAERSGLDRFRDRSDVGDPGGGRSVAARNTQEEFTGFIARANAAPAGQFRAPGSGRAHRGGAPGHGSQS